ncbi:MAG: ATP-binding protein [Actinomycetota bacterium]
MESVWSHPSTFFDAALPMVVIDRFGVVVAQNRACAEKFGVADPTLLSPVVFAERDRDEIVTLLGSVLRGDVPSATIDSFLTDREGRTLGARLWASPVLGDHGRPTHLVGTVADITDHLETLDRLERTSAAHAQFASNVSHEIRTPLHAILGLAELLAAGDLAERDASLAAAIVRESQALRSVIDDTLDMSRIDAGTIEIAADLFAPGELASGVVRILRPKASEKGLDLTVRLDPLTPRLVRGDEHRLRQILVNLMNNAVKFTERGRVSLEVYPLRDGLVRFVVGDPGPGIPPELQASVFDPFVRLHSDSADGGAGLGLAITSRLLHAMDGVIELESEVGVGTRFIVTIPLPTGSARDMGPVGRTADGEPSSEVSPLVLVVEDSEVNQLLVTSQLDRLGYRHHVVGSGPEAFAFLDERHDQIDTILMDWHLPGMDGLDVTRSIRATEERLEQRRLPIVAVTARAMAGDRQLCLDAGMDDFLAKPVSLERLQACLAQWTDGSTGAVEPADGAGAPSPGGSAVDTGVLGQLVNELGDADVVRTLIDTFLRELPNRVDAIRASDDPRRAAHTLKSTAAMLGAAPLAELCLSIEKGPGTAVDADGTAELDRLIGATTSELQEIAPGLGTP